MCHEYASRVWDRDRESEQREAESADGLPAFANEEGGEDVDILTDGGAQLHRALSHSVRQNDGGDES